MLEIPNALLIALNDADGNQKSEIDVMEAYDHARACLTMHGEEGPWLKAWGVWLAEHAEIEPLEHSQVRALWIQVQEVATQFLDDCKKKARMIASSPSCSVASRVTSKESES